MESIREIYRIGRGPSSSHTMGPERACRYVMNMGIDCDSYVVTLYGSLAYTGKGHGTDRVICETLDKPCTVNFNYENKFLLPHPNTMDICLIKDGKEVLRKKFMSVGGGKIEIQGLKGELASEIYDFNTFKDITKYCIDHDMNLWQYVETVEDGDFYNYMEEVWHIMEDAIKRGLKGEGVLPGGLGVVRKAKILYEEYDKNEGEAERENRMISSYAFAVSEENAASGKIVTAPTCGASGIVPAVLYYYKEKYDYSDRDIIHALYTGGLIGNLIKKNASISGAECGCQAEVGTACAMASAALAELLNYDFDNIEYASEIAIEHHLGLTCDPINGLVQIPCIERNAVSAMRAVHAVSLAKYLADNRKMSLDDVILVMKQTGLDLNSKYRETSLGGLARIRDLGKRLQVKRSVINKR